MGFYDFLPHVAQYAQDPGSVDRMNLRHRMILRPLARELAGRRVLDLAAHDGRWAYAFAGAGAREVVAVEGRQELVDRFAAFPDAALRAKVRLEQGDLFLALEALVARQERFDVIGVLGIFYHVIEHFRLLRMAVALRPELIIIDGEFALRPGAVILMSRERTDNVLNAIPQTTGQSHAVVGAPSPKAMEAMADALGYRCDWLDWGQVPSHRRAFVGDYYRQGEKRRATCLLRPHAQNGPGLR